MAGRSNQRSMGGPPPRVFHEPSLPSPFARSARHALPDDPSGARDGPFSRFSGPPHRPPRPAMVEEQLAAQHQEIQSLLVDNQRLATTHVALKQELAAAQHELRRAARAVGALHAENEAQLREMHEKSMKLESERRLAEAKKAELMQVRGDIQKLNASRLELTDQVQVLSQDVARAAAELQQAPVLKAEIETMKQEVQRVRSAIELEKKGYAENFEQGQVMEKNLIAISREVERLRAEIAEKRAQPAVTINSAAGYGSNYPNPHLAYGGNQYPAAYPANRASGASETAGYGAVAHAGWGGGHDFQRAHPHR
ncbi:protein FLX-like 1 [Wolffia australiana]